MPGKNRELIHRLCPMCKFDNTNEKQMIDNLLYCLKCCLRCGFVYLEKVPSYEILQSDFSWQKSWRDEKARRIAKEPTLHKFEGILHNLVSRMLKRDKLAAGVNTVTNAPFVKIDSEHIRDADGVISHLSCVGEPYCVEGPIKELSDLKNFKLRRPQSMDFLQIEILRSTFPDKAISFMLDGPFHRSWGKRICIMGNIDCSFLLVDGTPYEVEESVKNTIEIAAPGGGYIISSSNTIHPGCKAENYIAMVKAARKYGGYY